MVAELPRKPRCTILDRQDGQGHIFAVEPETVPGGGTFDKVVVWWHRPPGEPRKEALIIKQDGKRPEVIMLTLGQVYDIIDALNRAVESK